MKVKWLEFNDIVQKHKTHYLIAIIFLILITILSHYLLSFKEVVLAIDGETKKVMTRASTVSELLDGENIKYTSHDIITPDLFSSISAGDKVAIESAKPISVDINGVDKFLYTAAKDVNSALKELGIDPAGDIRVSYNGLNEIFTGMQLNISVLARRTDTKEIPIAFEKKRVDDPKLLKGRTRLSNRGQQGIKRQIIEYVMVGDITIETNIVNEEIIKQPTDEVTRVGTKIPQIAAVPTTPPAVNVSRSGRRFSMVSTAYATGDGGGAGSRTATGTGVYKGIAAVDPRVIPLGTRLYIDGYGSAIAADTGGAIKGNRIDLAFGSVAEALQWGRRSVTVHILN